MSGYGFGIWLVPKDRNIQKRILHTPHITIMCNMETEEYAKKLFDKIKTEMGDEFTLKINGKCYMFQGGYQSSDPLLACGYFCESENWSQFETICNNFYGDFSENPHMSHSYSLFIENLRLINIKDKEIECKLHLVDINGLHPTKWKIIE